MIERALQQTRHDREWSRGQGARPPAGVGVREAGQSRPGMIQTVRHGYLSAEATMLATGATPRPDRMVVPAGSGRLQHNSAFFPDWRAILARDNAIRMARRAAYTARESGLRGVTVFISFISLVSMCGIALGVAAPDHRVVGDERFPGGVAQPYRALRRMSDIGLRRLELAGRCGCGGEESGCACRTVRRGSGMLSSFRLGCEAYSCAVFAGPRRRLSRISPVTCVPGKLEDLQPGRFPVSSSVPSARLRGSSVTR